MGGRGRAAGLTLAVADVIVVELLPWVPRLIGRDEGRRLRLATECRPGETVLEVLKRFSAPYPNLSAELFDQSRPALGEMIEVAVNGSVLGIHHHLDSPLQPGDEILLLPRYEGG